MSYPSCIAGSTFETRRCAANIVPLLYDKEALGSFQLLSSYKNVEGLNIYLGFFFSLLILFYFRHNLSP